jgi:hypothetical protein
MPELWRSWASPAQKTVAGSGLRASNAKPAHDLAQFACGADVSQQMACGESSSRAPPGDSALASALQQLHIAKIKGSHLNNTVSIMPENINS